MFTLERAHGGGEILVVDIGLATRRRDGKAPAQERDVRMPHARLQLRSVGERLHGPLGCVLAARHALLQQHLAQPLELRVLGMQVAQIGVGARGGDLGQDGPRLAQRRLAIDVAAEARGVGAAPRACRAYFRTANAIVTSASARPARLLALGKPRQFEVARREAPLLGLAHLCRDRQAARREPARQDPQGTPCARHRTRPAPRHHPWRHPDVERRGARAPPATTGSAASTGSGRARRPVVSRPGAARRTE